MKEDRVNAGGHYSCAHGFALECVSFRSFLFSMGAGLFAVPQCLERSVQGTFSLEAQHERHGLYAPDAGTGGAGLGLDKPQSHGRRGHCEGRAHHRAGIPSPLRRAPRRAGGSGRLPGSSGGRHAVCAPGALLPSRQAAALHGSHFIVCARFNEFIVSKLLGGCEDVLLRHGVQPDDISVA